MPPRLSGEQDPQRDQAGTAHLVDVIAREDRAFIARLVERFGVPSSDVEDVTQAVLTSILRSTRSYDALRGKRRTWLYRITFYQSRSFLNRAYRRRERLVPPYLEEISAPPGSMVDEDNPETRAVSAEDRRLVRESIAWIQIHQRAVFIAYEILEMSMEEIARSLGIPESTGWSRLQRARRELAAALKKLRSRRASTSRRRRR